MLRGRFKFLKMEIGRNVNQKWDQIQVRQVQALFNLTTIKRGCRNKVDVVCDRPQSVLRRKMIQRSIFIKLIYLKYLTAYYSRPPCFHSPISAYCIAYLYDMHTESYYTARTEKKNVFYGVFMISPTATHSYFCDKIRLISVWSQFSTILLAISCVTISDR